MLAGAGSGKTTVLIQRIANLITFGCGSDSPEVPFAATEEDLAFLEGLEQEVPAEDQSRAERLCALRPAAPWNIIAITCCTCCTSLVLRVIRDAVENL